MGILYIPEPLHVCQTPVPSHDYRANTLWECDTCGKVFVRAGGFSLLPWYEASEDDIADIAGTTLDTLRERARAFGTPEVNE